MADENSVADVVGNTLRHFALGAAYASEQRELQPAVQAVLEQALENSFPDSGLQTTISVGGAGKPSLQLLGTSFWPDVEISDEKKGLVAIEVKLIQPNRPASKAIAEAIGQSLIYSIRYPRAYAFIVHYGKSDDGLRAGDTKLMDQLLRLNIELIVREGNGDGNALSS